MSRKKPHNDTTGPENRAANAKDAPLVALSWQNLGEYLTERREQRGLSLRGLAAELEVAPAHLSRIATGKTKPNPDTCKRIAEYFGDPVILVLRVAGWVDDEDITADDFMKLFYSAIKDDPDLQILFKVYQQQNTPEKRHAFVRSIQAAFGVKTA
ncbi:MAG: helix-turn-helix transcriptional regulator [Anaerolineales bacterium]|nr:helix-turn-helix transcriptional regulator [Anaerolineales bacterium]